MINKNHYYRSLNVKDALNEAGLDSFDAIWNISSEWFEPINQRRQGWSGVITWPENNVNWFIKRQENHNTRTLLHPFSGIPTFRKEFNNFTAFQKASIPTLRVDFYAERKVSGKHQAILVTRALNQHQELYSWYEEHKENNTLVREVFDRMAKIIRYMHDKGFVHNCLYPNHIFLGGKNTGSYPDIRLIDLEKVKKFPFVPSNKRIEEIKRFFEHTHGKFLKVHLEGFLNSYLDKPLSSRNRIRHSLAG